MSNPGDMNPPNLRLRDRPIDIFFMVIFSLFLITSIIADALPALNLNANPDATGNVFLEANNSIYADADPLFRNPPFWMRIVTGLSAFVYMPFYALLVLALVRGWNWIQLPSVIYATMISSITGIIVFGVEFFGEPEWRTPDPRTFLSFNIAYVVIPLILLVRMRKPLPFTRKF